MTRRMLCGRKADPAQSRSARLRRREEGITNATSQPIDLTALVEAGGKAAGNGSTSFLSSHPNLAISAVALVVMVGDMFLTGGLIAAPFLDALIQLWWVA
jgi:hypothetical protein